MIDPYTDQFLSAAPAADGCSNTATAMALMSGRCVQYVVPRGSAADPLGGTVKKYGPYLPYLLFDRILTVFTVFEKVFHRI